MRQAVIFGMEGLALNAFEKDFFRDVNPFGFILFARNIADPDQLRKLTDSLRELSGDSDVPILIDQEGGRVRRMRPPHWVDSFAMAPFGALYKKDKEKAISLLELQCDLQSSQFHQAGINVTCAPVLDVSFPETHDVIGDRAFSDDIEIVGELGRIVTDRFLQNGILPVIKHIPGHGRATADSHLELPVVIASSEDLRAKDFPPFKHVNHAPMAMTAHILYEALDAENCATMSESIIRDVIRDELGFDGLLMSDDLSMKALSGDFSTKTKACLVAGCDFVLHCNGDQQEMLDVAKALKPLSEKAISRWEKARQSFKTDFNPMNHYEQETAVENLRKNLF